MQAMYANIHSFVLSINRHCDMLRNPLMFNILINIFFFIFISLNITSTNSNVACLLVLGYFTHIIFNTVNTTKPVLHVLCIVLPIENYMLKVCDPKVIVYDVKVTYKIGILTLAAVSVNIATIYRV